MDKKGNIKTAVVDIIQTLVLALAIFMIIYLFLFQPHQVEGESMLPTFENGEYLLTEKVSYRFSLPQRGDIIVFEAPPNPDKDFIKRIIGLPGEEIDINEGHVFVNGKLLKEDYIPSHFYTSKGIFNRIKLAKNEYFVLGDNRNNSSDSRQWGPVKKQEIIGKAWVVYWPPNKIGFVPKVNY